MAKRGRKVGTSEVGADMAHGAVADDAVVPRRDGAVAVRSVVALHAIDKECV